MGKTVHLGSEKYLNYRAANLRCLLFGSSYKIYRSQADGFDRDLVRYPLPSAFFGKKCLRTARAHQILAAGRSYNLFFNTQPIQ